MSYENRSHFVTPYGARWKSRAGQYMVDKDFTGVSLATVSSTFMLTRLSESGLFLLTRSEVVGEAGILVHPQDVGAQMSASGLDRARQFRWERTAQQTHAVFKELT